MALAIAESEIVADKEYVTENLFKDTLREIARLEEMHNLLGVRFSLREGVRGSIIRAEELATHVLDIIHETIKLSKVRDSIPLVEKYNNV